MSAATRRIYEAVARRADGACECCGRALGEQAQLDHALSRRVRESAQNCWMIHRECHENFTANRPDGMARFHKFIAHCIKYGFTGEQLRAESRLVFVTVRAGLSVRGCDI